MYIHKNIKGIAKKKNIAQKHIAEVFGVSENQMTNYLTGRTKITAEQIPLFAETLRVSIEDLFVDPYQKKIKQRTSKDMSIKYFNCPECIKKQNTINDVEAERDSYRQKYIECLEELAGRDKKTS